MERREHAIGMEHRVRRELVEGRGGRKKAVIYRSEDEAVVIDGVRK